MQKTYLFTAIIIAAVLFFQLVITPYSNKKSAMQVALYILDHWQQKDILTTIDFWENPDRFPPVTSIESYEITWQRFYRIDKQSYVEVYAKIDFGQESPLDNNKEWLIKLANTRLGWLIVNFKPSHLRGETYIPPKRVYNSEKDLEILQQFQEKSNIKDPGIIEMPTYDTPASKTNILPARQKKSNYRTIPAAASQ